MTLTIVEVLQRSIQGRTKPYICRADDGAIYYVKGRSATRNGLMAEWLGAELATAFGLPIAPYMLASVPDELIEADTTGWLADLGGGEVFASQRVDSVEMTVIHRDRTPTELRQDLLVFDWWVRNDDRTLTERGGNPNLLWKHEVGDQLVVIDHNLAFDPAFSVEGFRSSHVFADEIPGLFSDFLARDTYRQRLREALSIWPQACAMIPAEWNYVDTEMTIPATFSLDQTLALLRRCEQDEFWSLEP